MDAEDAQRREEEEDTGLLPMTEGALAGDLGDAGAGTPESELRNRQDAAGDPGPVPNITDFDKADVADDPAIPFRERVEEAEQ